MQISGKAKEKKRLVKREQSLNENVGIYRATFTRLFMDQKEGPGAENGQSRPAMAAVQREHHPDPTRIAKVSFRNSQEQERKKICLGCHAEFPIEGSRLMGQKLKKTPAIYINLQLM